MKLPQATSFMTVFAYLLSTLNKVEATTAAYAKCNGKDPVGATAYFSCCNNTDAAYVMTCLAANLASNCYVPTNTDCLYSNTSFKAEPYTAKVKSEEVQNAQDSVCRGNPNGGTTATMSYYCCNTTGIAMWSDICPRANQVAACSGTNPTYCSYFNYG